MVHDNVKYNFVRRILVIVNYFALKLVKRNVNFTCYWICHQPEEPEEAKKFRKF